MPFDFADSYDDAAEIPAEFQPLYSEGDDGTFAFNSDTYGGVRTAYLGQAKALKNARAAEKGQISRFFEPLAEYGDNPDAVLKTFAEKVEEAKKAAAQEAGASNDEDFQRRVEKMRGEITGASEKALGERDATIGALRTQLEKVLGEGAARQALAGKTDAPDLVLPFIREHLRTVEDSNGQLHVVVVDADGDPRENPVTAQPVTIDDLVQELRENEKFGRLFSSDSPSGGGTTPTQRPVSPAKVAAQQARASMTPHEKIKAGLAKGQATNGRGRGRIN